MSKPQSIENFIQKANVVHNFKYDYSCVIYKNNYTKIDIKCLSHGIFKQNPGSHLAGHGCPCCVRGKSVFIDKARLKHKNKFSYSKVVYKNRKTKVILTCKKHGDFSQTPLYHLLSNGCPACTHEKLHPKSASPLKKVSTQQKCPKDAPDKTRLSEKTSEFIKKAIAIHGDRYDYSYVDYIKNKEYVIINCKIHGLFYQRPTNHLDGKGCAKCNQKRRYSRTLWTSYAKDTVCSLYLIEMYDNNESFLKVGITSKLPVNKRLKQIKANYKFKVINIIYGNAEFVFNEEVVFQKLFKKYKYHPLKKFGGYTECYSINIFDIAFRYFKEKGEKIISPQLNFALPS